MAERVEFAVLGQVGECRQRRDWCPLQCVEPELVGGAVVERLHRGWQVFIICGGCPLAGYIVDPECTVARVSAEHYCFCRVRGNGVDISGASAVDTQLVGYGRCRQCLWRQGFAGEIPYCGCIEKHGIDPLAFRIVDSGRRDAGDRWWRSGENHSRSCGSVKRGAVVYVADCHAMFKQTAEASLGELGAQQVEVVHRQPLHHDADHKLRAFALPVSAGGLCGSGHRHGADGRYKQPNYSRCYVAFAHLVFRLWIPRLPPRI